MIITPDVFRQRVKICVDGICEETRDKDRARELAWGYAETDEWAIYTATAWDVVYSARQWPRVYAPAVSMLDEMGYHGTLDNHICRLAFCILYSAITTELDVRLTD